MVLSVTPQDISQLLGRSLTSDEQTRALLDIEYITETLESWARRKFTSVTIHNEMHIIQGTGQFPVFLRWGDPVGDVQVRRGSLTATPITFDGDAWPPVNVVSAYYANASNRVYITYTVDTALVDEYEASIKRIICNAVIKSLLQPAAVRFNVINSYSVEGLSISFGGGLDSGMNTMTERQDGFGPFSVIDLAPISALKRRVVL